MTSLSKLVFDVPGQFNSGVIVTVVSRQRRVLVAFGVSTEFNRSGIVRLRAMPGTALMVQFVCFALFSIHFEFRRSPAGTKL